MTYVVSVYQFSRLAGKDLLVARVYCDTASQALSEGAHYAFQYEEEGVPVSVSVKNPKREG
jgi:hypothetical protein